MKLLISDKIIYSRKAVGIYKIGYDKVRSINRMAYYDKYYENKISFHLMVGVLTCLNEIS